MAESIPTSATSTPKRKRSQMLAEDIVIPSNATTSSSLEDDDGSYSPRTRVTHRFHNLTIGHSHPPRDGSRSGEGAEAPLLAVAPTFMPQDDGPGEAMEEDTDDDAGARKRFKPYDLIQPQSPTEEDNFTATGGAGDAIPPGPELSVAINLDRPGTPPLKLSSPRKDKHSIANTDSKQSSPSPSQIIPPSSTSSPELSTTSPPDFRAALTWQEEEITIYDPDDSDDDGTGINGIGFKPTAAVAYARGMKRKQQLAEYRKREEKEARARRNMRRRGTPTPVPEGIKGKERDKDKDKGMMKKVQDRRVRFLEATGGIPRVGFEGATEGVKAGQ